MADELCVPELNQWVFVMGWNGCKYPLGMFGTDEEVLERVEKNPTWIFFLGPKELADVNWASPIQDLKLYIVWAQMDNPETDTVDYDVVHSAVVVASSEEEAIRILTTVPRLEVPETSVPHPTKGWPTETMTYPLEFDPNATLLAKALDITYKRVVHSHMHYG